MSTIIVGCDNPEQVEENVRIVKEFTPLTEKKMAELVAKTQEIQKQALFFRNWA